MPKPKILLFDIETKPLEVYVWGLGEQYVGIEQIKEDTCILSWAAKWRGSKEMFYRDQRKAKNILNDKVIMQDLWELLDEADVVITQNGKSFDAKRVNARFIEHGMQPPSSYRHIDTLQIARKVFGFTSNKLAYTTEKLNTKYKKLTHKKFPGLELWKQCLAGNIEAWKEMETYNKHDVLSLEEYCDKLLPWDTSVNLGVYGEIPACSCGSMEFQKRGFFFTNTGKYQRYRCKQCGAETRSGKNLLTKDRRAEMHRGVSR